MTVSATRFVLVPSLTEVLCHLCTGSPEASSTPSQPAMDCLEAEHGCVLDPGCTPSYRVLEYCAAEEAVSPLGPEARRECLEAQNSLQQYQPLLACKCQRGSRREEPCLRVYWTVRFSQGKDDYHVSPYEDLELELVRHIEMSRMASIVAASSLPPSGQNLCLKAAQDCGLYEKCGSLRSEYVVACTKLAPGSDRCNRQKCHRALRRFLERVPEEYSFSLLFCPCADALCGERRRKTIVPSCSYEERGSKPSCLSLRGYCLRDELCRSRLADFQHNCQPSAHSPSGCLRESGAVCLKAYSGLIGTIMTPNYVSNSSMEVSQWCSCEGSGNQWQECLRVLHMFSDNGCLRNAMSAVGSTPPRPVEKTSPPPPRPTPSPSPPTQRNVMGADALPDLSTVEEPEDKEEEGEFNVIPPYSKESTVGSSACGGLWGVLQQEEVGCEAGAFKSKGNSCNPDTPAARGPRCVRTGNR
ncbi:GDNF family receptor alpha-4-like [Scleropages formosus]|uniref:GDNF family receptor alpha-4-like n=1 Tax=Scleropages formosus TaxID=113540 RepID=A0A0P7V9D2_SCLFO|nr:GDNF family receptor alpha-4-like [Scleropages formosus]